MDARVNFRHSGTARTRSYGVDATFTLFQRRGWDIHAVSAEPDRRPAEDHRSQEYPRNAGTPGIAVGCALPAMISSAALR